MNGFDGLHLMGNLHGCAGAEDLLREVDRLREHCLSKVEEAGLSAVGECFHQFGGKGGVTGVVVLAESHISIHTWPEKNYVTLDVFVCNMHSNNRNKAMRLFNALVFPFNPAEKRLYRVER
ncbi:MAG: adenosylmethionine decarboxylase, partial [Nitrosomonadales bacterium]